MVLVKQVLIICAFIFGLLNPIFSQSCKNYNKKYDCWVNKSRRGYSQYGQAKSAKLKIDEKYIYNIILYGQKDYEMIFCTNYDFYPIHFVITDVNSKKVLYNNETDNYIESIGFIVEKNINVSIEVVLLGERIKRKNYSATESCVGIQIIWKKIPQIGFK